MFQYSSAYPTPAVLYDVTFDASLELFAAVGEFSTIVFGSEDADAWSIVPAPPEHVYQGEYRFVNALNGTLAIEREGDETAILTDDGVHLSIGERVYNGGVGTGCESESIEW